MLTAACFAFLFGQVLTADGEPATGLRVVVQWSRNAVSSFAPDTVDLDRLADFDELRILVIPRRWTILHGCYAGTTVKPELSDALRRTNDRGSFGRVAAHHVVAWDEASFPLGVVLRHDLGPAISPRDSVAFWQAARRRSSDRLAVVLPHVRHHGQRSNLLQARNGDPRGVTAEDVAFAQILMRLRTSEILCSFGSIILFVCGIGFSLCYTRH